jgi:1,4-dihydroxy-2-naphthoyl-CoA hydrolase
MQTDDLTRSLGDASPFDAHYGLTYHEITDQRVVASVPVGPHLHQPTGVVHGGVYASIAEAAASSGTNWSVTTRGEIGMGMSNNTSFLRSVSAGTLHAVATPRHRGRTTWVWDVEITDDDGRLAAVSRVTIAVRVRSS